MQENKNEDDIQDIDNDKDKNIIKDEYQLNVVDKNDKAIFYTLKQNNQPKQGGSQVNPFFQPGRIKAIIGYLVCLFVLSSFLFIFIAGIYCSAFKIDYMTLAESLTSTDLKDYSDDVKKANAICQGISNLLGYLLATIVVVFFLRDKIKADFEAIKKSKKIYILYAFLAGIAFVGVTYGIDVLFANLAPSSENQATIEVIMTYGGLIPMAFAVVFLAPVVEELIYRKVIFSYLDKYHVAISYVVSSLVFTLPHMLSSSMENPLVWLLQSIPYLASGALLCCVYHLFKKNAFASILVHMLNNLFAVVLILISLYGGA